MPTSSRNDEPTERPVVRIGSVARMLGLTPRALRYWEQRGLLPAAHRTGGGSRVYDEDQVTAARGVLRLKRAGLSLDDICALQEGMRQSRTALAGMTGLAAILAEREVQIRERLADLQALQLELTAAREAVMRCDGCHGKAFDTLCISCLAERSSGQLPSCLRSILDASAPPPPEISP